VARAKAGSIPRAGMTRARADRLMNRGAWRVERAGGTGGTARAKAGLSREWGRAARRASDAGEVCLDRRTP
jgi:hypothetical protein